MDLDTTDSSVHSAPSSRPDTSESIICRNTLNKGILKQQVTGGVVPSSENSSQLETMDSLPHRQNDSVELNSSSSSQSCSSSAAASSSGTQRTQESAEEGFILRRRYSSNSNNSVDFFNNSSSTNIKLNASGDSTSVTPPPGNVIVSRRIARGEREKLCTSPISGIIGSALNQMNLKRSSSAPMINQLGMGMPKDTSQPRFGALEIKKCNSAFSPAPSASRPTSLNCSPGPSTSSGHANIPNTSTGKETPMEIDASSFANSFLASLNHTRPRRFSASFSPGSPGPTPNRINQLRSESNTDWETASEKEFIGTMSIAQSWEDLSLEPMNMELPQRRASISEQLWLSINPGTSSASSSPAASPSRLLNRFSPAQMSPSPTRKSFTSRRSLSPISIRPSVLSGVPGFGVGIGLKRKCDWDSQSNQMDCSPQPPAKRSSGLLGFTQSPYNSGNNSGMNSPVNTQLLHSHLLTSHGESPSSLDTGTESNVSSISCAGENDSPFFRPVDSPLNSTSDISSPEATPCSSATKT